VYLSIIYIYIIDRYTICF